MLSLLNNPKQTVKVKSVYLVKGWKDVISELDFGDRGGAGSSHSDSEGDNTLLGDRCVEDSVLS